MNRSSFRKIAYDASKCLQNVSVTDTNLFGVDRRGKPVVGSRDRTCATRLGSTHRSRRAAWSRWASSAEDSRDRALCDREIQRRQSWVSAACGSEPPAEGERQRRKVDDGNCRDRLNWRRDTTDGTDLTPTEFLLGDTRMFIYYRTYNICRSCYAVSRRWRFDCWERKTFSARTWKIPRLGPRRANLIFANSTR